MLPRLLLGLVLLAPLAAQGQAAPGLADVVRDLSIFITDEMRDQGLTGVSIAIADRDRIAWSSGFGFADRTAGRRATGDTVYRVASISKLFTATAVMQMLERGDLDLDRPVREFVPAFQPRNQFDVPITLRHLLAHHAGILREPGVGHYFEEGRSLTALVESMSGQPLIFRPGTKFKYSNAGVSIAGRAVELVAGADFAAHMAHKVLAPLGMEDSSFAADSPVAKRCAVGYMHTLDGRTFPAPTFELGMMPSANLYTTVEDLLRFAQSLYLCESERPKLLQAETLREMFRPHFRDRDVGIGFFLGRLDGNLRVRHGGAIYGFATELSVLPEQGLAVAVATTEDFASGSVERIAMRALRSVLAARAGEKLPAANRPKPVGAERARALAGRYRDGKFWIELYARGDELIEIPSDGLPTTYRARAEGPLVGDSYFQRRWGSRRLEPIDGGVLRNGRRLARIPDQPPAAAPERFLPLIGEYGWDHDVLYLFEDGGKLCCLIEWFARYPLEELGEDRFRMPDFGMYSGEAVTIERGDSGEVAAVTVGAVRFARRAGGVADGVTFKINARFPLQRLRAMAREARMPVQPDGLREPDLVDLVSFESRLRFDLRYATRNNFMDTVFYEVPRAMMQRPAAEALASAQRSLAERGIGLLVYDAYRPWEVTKMFWDATPEDMKQFVADPSKGSRHNRGCAVDLTLCSLEDGAPLPMVSGYDEFTERAYPDYPGGTQQQRWYRQLLRRVMEQAGFSVYEWEWWHFDYELWREYPVQNVPLK